MTGWIRRLTHRVGYRGATLLLLSIVNLSFGWIFIDPDPGQEIVNRYLSAAIPFTGEATAAWVWASLWWAGGLVCLTAAFLDRDWPGYAAALALYVAYVAAVILGGTHGMPGAPIRTIVWTIVAGWVLIEARRAEPSRNIGEVARELEETGEIPRLPTDEGQDGRG